MNKELFKNILTTQIPIAWIAGVRLESWEENKVSTRVKYGFLNQNPFKSMFWAVQGMAAEFSSGLMANAKIAKSGEDIEHFQLQHEVVKLVREQIGAVASLRDVVIVQRLPKTRSGKILRKMMRSIADGEQFQIPSTIDDEAIIDEIRDVLQHDK